jgi:hypothetical protein
MPHLSRPVAASGTLPGYARLLHSFTFTVSVTVSLDWIFQWRESLQDGVYAVPGFVIRAAETGVEPDSSHPGPAQRFAGKQIVAFGFRPTRESFMRANS